MSITSRINEMSSHIEQAYDELQGLGADLTNVNKNIENISMVLDDIYDSLPSVSDEGTSLTLDDTRVGKIKSTLKGNTSQTTYSGKNLFKVSNGTFTKNGVTATIKDSIITLNGTATANVYLVITSNEDRYSHTFSGNYTISKITSATTIGSALYGTDSGGTDRAFLTINNNASTKTQAINETYTSIRVQLNIDNGATFNNTIVKIQLESGSSATDFEPFVGGTASPNPSYPQPVNVVSGDNEINVVGKNLFRIGKTSSTQNGVTYSYNEDGTLSLSGTATGTTYFSVTDTIDNACIVNGESYKFSINKTIPSGIRFKIELYNGTSYVREYYVENSSSPATISINLSNITTIKYIIQVNNGVTTNISNVGVQLERGSSATSFMPFSRDTYPIYLGVENLLQNTATSQVINGISFIKNEDGSVLVNGTATANAILILNSFNFEANTTYTLNGCASGGSASTYKLDAFGGSGLSEDIGNGVQISVGGTRNIRIVVFNGATINNLLFKPQITKGNTSHSYTPYGKAIELCKIGNYQDYFYKDSGKWYLHKEIGKVVLNGSENWIKSASTSVDRFIEQTTRPDMSVFNGLSNYFIYNQDSPNVGTFFLDNSQNQFRGRIIINFSSYGTTTLEQFKTWLSTHNTKIYYVLSTPTNTEITYQPLIDQLNLLEKAMSKDGQTNISQVNNDLPFIISASALKEWSV